MYFLSLLCGLCTPEISYQTLLLLNCVLTFLVLLLSCMQQNTVMMIFKNPKPNKTILYCSLPVFTFGGLFSGFIFLHFHLVILPVAHFTHCTVTTGEPHCCLWIGTVEDYRTPPLFKAYLLGVL